MSPVPSSVLVELDLFYSKVDSTGSLPGKAASHAHILS
jgi:hypothetical protein